MAVNNRVNSAVAKRLWNVLRIAFFMIRKGLVSKRKLLMDMNLMMKRGKLLRKSLSNLIHHHHHHHSSRHVMTRGSFGVQEYEFSCSNSPNPVFFHVSSSKRHKHHYFPCINSPQVIEDDDEMNMSSRDDSVDDSDDGDRSKGAVVLAIPKTPEYTFNIRFDSNVNDVGAGNSVSPFSVRVSNFSSEEYDQNDNGSGNRQVDDEAEEFIRRFYEQLRKQSRVPLLQ